MTQTISTVGEEMTVPQAALRALYGALGDDLVAVVLYGSRARGEAHETSDWDLLVIADDLPDQTLARHLFLKRALPAECRGVASLLAKAREEFKSSLPSLYLDIALDREILYDRQEFATTHLAEIRQMVKRLGLLREQTPTGYVWIWQDGQPAGWPLEWST